MMQKHLNAPPWCGSPDRSLLMLSIRRTRVTFAGSYLKINVLKTTIYHPLFTELNSLSFINTSFIFFKPSLKLNRRGRQH